MDKYMIIKQGLHVFGTKKFVAGYFKFHDHLI